jgi:hypothetical protein
MNNELEQLREVARAAAAMIKADDESKGFAKDWRDRPELPPVDQLRDFHRLSSIYFACRAELVAALTRLAELNSPPTPSSPA